MKKPNEQNACDAFITILKSLTDTDYAELESPDEVNRSTPDVDFVLVSGSDEDDKVAIEHTTVQSFEGQIRYVDRWRRIADSVNVGCKERIPPDRYYFLVATPVIMDSLAKKSSRERFIGTLVSWVAEAAPKLLLVDSYIRTEYEGHKITLVCSGDHERLNGNVWGMPEEPESQKTLQSERLVRAVRDKLPKLMKYKSPGFKTALLLEDVTGTLRGNTLSKLRDCEISLEEVDYIVVLVSNESRMIIGNVWKEGSVWHSSVPSNRRFGFRPMPYAPSPDFRT